MLVVLATLTRSALGRWRGRMMATGKNVLDGLLAVVGVMIFTGLDWITEGLLVSTLSQWLTDPTKMI